ncbi:MULTISPECIES: hypothetical protein [unclassified Mesorhizobium]|uniref:hypothetical protein n=1 Tax=unclassified Mesorhizobium TaxID=325217 RepID=UPI001FED72EE|nr:MULTISPECIES: hypothetical protein [unclassified Mesorhizobium]
MIIGSFVDHLSRPSTFPNSVGPTIIPFDPMKPNAATRPVRLWPSDREGWPGNLHVELGRDRLDCGQISRNLQSLPGNRREKAFETSRGQDGDPLRRLDDDERVLNASGNVEYFSGAAFGSFPGAPEAQPSMENDEDFVGLEMAVAWRSVARTSIGCKCPELAAGLARRQERFVVRTVPIGLSTRCCPRLHLRHMWLE